MYKFRITDINVDKELPIVFNSIYGLGWHKSIYILSLIGFSFPNDEIVFNVYFKNIFFFYLETFVMSIAKINRYVDLRIKKLKDLNTYKGVRHTLFLPVHGQRTRTNANSQRSKRRKLEESFNY